MNLLTIYPQTKDGIGLVVMHGNRGSFQEQIKSLDKVHRKQSLHARLYMAPLWGKMG
jgi:hypothetical protein